MKSHLLEGKVRHRRSAPFTYGLEHDVWYAALDLAELDELDRRLRLFGHNRRAAAVFRDADHLPQSGARHRRRDPRPPAGRGRGPGRLARDAGDKPARAGTRLQSGQLLPLPGPGRRAEGRGGRGAQHLRRAACVYAQARDGDRTPRPVHGPDGEGLLRVAVHRASMGDYAVHVRDEPDGLRLAINLARTDGPCSAPASCCGAGS